MGLRITAILCTYNPRLDYLNRVLDALRLQTLELDYWELIVIDNASDLPVEEIISLKWHPNGHITRESNQGLTPARLRGIKEANADLLVFVDDDNILDKDYFKIAIQIAKEYPFIGAFGGNCIPEFESKTPAGMQDFGILALREVTGNIWSNDYFGQTLPYGAGMVIRKVVALRYSEVLQTNVVRKSLDRTGSSLLSAGDRDMALTAIDVGMGCGLFTGLTLTHLISADRLKPEYLIRLKRSTRFSNILLSYIRHGVRPDLPKLTFREVFGKMYRLVVLDSFQRKMMEQNRLAIGDFYKFIKENNIVIE